MQKPHGIYGRDCEDGKWESAFSPVDLLYYKEDNILINIDIIFIMETIVKFIFSVLFMP